MKINITPECYAQIRYYVDKADIEISGLGRVQRASDGTMTVTSVYLLKQENSAASTDIDPDAVAQLQFESRNDKGDLNFWWHSHVNMQVFWSGTDMATIKEFGKRGYLLATVFNKKDEYRSAYFQGANDFLPELFVDDLDTEFNYLPTAIEQKKWEENYTTLCKEKKWEPVSTFNPSEYASVWNWDEDNASVPLAHRNKDFYKADSKQLSFPLKDTQIAVGQNSGYTIAEMIHELNDLRAYAKDILEETKVIDRSAFMLLHDVYFLMYGTEPSDPEDLDHLLAMLVDQKSYLELCKDLRIEARAYTMGAQGIQ